MPEAPKYKKSEIRYQRILEAALELFLAKGYEATGLSDIIAKSGGSLSSVYKYFDNKETLFLNIVEQQSKKLDERMNERMRINSNLPLREYLKEFAGIYLEFLFASDTMKFHRLILSSGFSGALRESPRIFLKNGVLGSPRALNEYLDAHMSEFAQGRTSDRLALYFCFLLREPHFSRLLFFDEEPKFKASELIKDRIDIFLNGMKKHD